MDVGQVMANMEKAREALEGCEARAVRDLVAGDRLAFVPTGRHERVARHPFRCEGTVTEVGPGGVVIHWDECPDCGPARKAVWRRSAGGPCWVIRE
jgi:hypothetical protein